MQLSGTDIIQTIKSMIRWHIGDENIIVIKANALDNADNKSISFCSYKEQDKAITTIEKTKASIVICSANVIKKEDAKFENKLIIAVDNPRLSFIKVLTDNFLQKIKPGIHKTASIDSGAQIGKNVFIGANACIGKVKIGNNVTIHNNSIIYDNVEIGNNVTIKAGCVISSDGYGFERREDGVLERFPHIGSVVIENDVEIGANTCIDRGTLGATIIRQGAKIDNLVHIAHNCDIGKHSVIVANSLIGGSSKVGDYAWIGPSSTIIDGITLGNWCLIGIGAVVIKSVPENAVMVGNPARYLRNNRNDF